MTKEKKNYSNFACKMDADIFERLDEYSKISGQTKTYVVERALRKYLDENFETNGQPPTRPRFIAGSQMNP